MGSLASRSKGNKASRVSRVRPATMASRSKESRASVVPLGLLVRPARTLRTCPCPGLLGRPEASAQPGLLAHQEAQWSALLVRQELTHRWPVLLARQVRQVARWWARQDRQVQPESRSLAPKASRVRRESRVRRARTAARDVPAASKPSPSTSVSPSMVT